MARLTPFEIGQIKAHLHHGLGATAIANLVAKIDAAISAGPHVRHLWAVMLFVLRISIVNNA